MNSKARQQGPKGIPDFIEILSIEDKELYEELQKKVGSTNYRYNRNRRFDSLKEIFQSIRDYCEKDDEDQWKRYLVCGICWFGDYLAINTRQLRLLISKSKSAINDALSKMGYETVTAQGERASLLFDKIPFLCGHFTEFRKWSIRKQNPSIDEISITRKSCKNKCKIINEVCCVNENQDGNCDNYFDELFKDIDWENDYCKEDEKDGFVFINFDKDVDEIFVENDCLNSIFHQNVSSCCFKSEEVSRVY